MIITEKQKEVLLSYVKDFQEDYKEFDEKKISSIKKLKSLVEDFIYKRITLKEFKERSELMCREFPYWGFKGTSGQMQLNQYVKNIDDKRKENMLREALIIPKNEHEVAEKINSLSNYITELKKKPDHPKGFPWPSQIFMLTYFWEIQIPEKWPTYFYSLKKVLSNIGFDFSTLDSYGEEYLKFVEIMNAIKRLYKEEGFIDKEHPIWFIEHVLWRQHQNQQSASKLLKPEERKQERKIGDAERQGIKMKEFNLPSLIKSIDYKKVKYDFHALRNPERIKIRDIITNAEKRWVLPNFQRYFDWGKEDIRSFLESIFSDYYVGAFLLWDIKGEPELDVIPIKSVKIKPGSPESIILDGQQRITSLHYAIETSDDPNFVKDSNCPVYFYIDLKSFFRGNEENGVIKWRYARYSEEESYKKMLFPFYQLGEYKKWVDGFEDFLAQYKPDLGENDIRSVRRIIERRLGHIWDGFEIPYISLSETITLKQVADIFEKINTRGKLLSVFDLLIARLLKYDVKLRDWWNDCLKSYVSIKRYFKKSQKIPIYVFQAISLFYSKTSSCKRKDILDIYKIIYQDSDFSLKEHWDEFSDYIDLAIKKIEGLRSGFGVKNEKEVPFIPMIPIIAALLKEIDSRDNKAECNKKLNIWYWSSVFSNVYSSAVDSTMTADFKELRAWFNDDSNVPRSVTNARKEIQILELRRIKKQSNAIYRGILSLLALEGAKDFDTNENLENARDNQRDHIFPRSKEYGFGMFKDIDSILNITWMSKDTNIRIKRCKKPSVYLKEFIKEKYGNNEDEFLSNLKTHFISRKAYECMSRDDLEGFLDEREKTFLSKIKELIGVGESESGFSMITPQDPFKNKIIFGNVIQSCEEYLYWIDKYFSLQGLRLLSQFLNESEVKNLKILMSIDKVDENFRGLFKDFKSEMKNKGVSCELRVITDRNSKSQIHDRWIISKYKSFNIPSPDTIARGQYSEIKETGNKPPFEEWWQESKDIITDWNIIKDLI